MHRNTTRLVIVALLLAAVAVLGLAQAGPTGLDVMTNVFERPQPDDMEGGLTMTLENARGAQRIRSVHQYVARFDGVEKKLLFFTCNLSLKMASLFLSVWK